MTGYAIPLHSDGILAASPGPVMRQRVLERLRSPVRGFEQASGGAEALVSNQSRLPL